MFPIYSLVWDHPLEYGRLLGVMAIKKTESPSTCNQQLSMIAPQQGVEVVGLPLLHAGMLTGLF